MTVNSALEVAFCADTSTDLNVVGRSIGSELHEVAGVRVACGAVVSCHECVVLDLHITTVAGPL
ncbi:hypothetical protein PybrP1_002130 [[Pythium] brassicae (nom. inval.)]|nr:hypothetical protein PybrP1_002130 [[Pythium] brassicae (nom. inval.)]